MRVFQKFICYFNLCLLKEKIIMKRKGRRLHRLKSRDRERGFREREEDEEEEEEEI